MQIFAEFSSHVSTFLVTSVLVISVVFIVLYFICYCFLIFFVLLFIFYLLLRSGDIHQNPGPRNDCRILYSNIRGLKANLQDLSVASTKFDIIFCSETLVSSFRHTSELLIPNFNKPILLRRNAIPRAQGMCVYIRSSYSASRLSKSECGCHEMMALRFVANSIIIIFFLCTVILTWMTVFMIVC